MDLRIVLLPDEENSKLVCDYSKQLANQYSVRFELNEHNIPHITLLHVQSNEKQLEEIKKIMDGTAKKHSIISVEKETIKGDPGDETYIGIYFKNTEVIERLRQEIYSNITTSIEHVSSFKEPHLTLTRLVNGNGSSIASSLDTNLIQDLIFSKIAICAAGENGVCTDILYEKELRHKV